MEKKSLNDRDLKEMNDLIAISKTMYNVYNKLMLLEEQHSKDNEEYQTNIGYLKLILELEENEYKKISAKGYYVVLKYLKDMIKAYKIDLDSDFLDVLLNNNKDLIPIQRVISKLRDIVVIKYPESLNNTENQSTINYTKLNLKNSKLISETILKCFLINLSKQIDEEDNLPIRKELIDAKYTLSYISTDISDEALNHNFNTDDLEYNYSDSKIRYNNTIPSIYYAEKQRVGITLLLEHIPNILEIRKKDKLKEKKEYILRRTVVATTLDLIGDKETILEVIKAFKDYLTSPDYLTNHKNNKTREHDLLNLFQEKIDTTEVQNKKLKTIKKRKD